jgi:hypothetical protein
MRLAMLLCVTAIFIPQGLRAQWQSYTETPRYELGLQVDVAYLNGVSDWGGGAGVRFHYNFDEHFALDSELTYRLHNVFTSNALSSATVGQTSGLFGIRAGQRVRDVGFFAQARAGFLHFNNNNTASLLTRNTVPAFDVGGTLERYLGPVVLRVGLSEQIVAYGNARVSPGPPMPPQPLPGQLGTRASPLLGLGFAIRF